MEYKLHSLLRSSGLNIPKTLHNPIIKSITCDSRKVRKNSLFIAINGQNVDGCQFLKEAFSAGAAAAIVSRESSSLNLLKTNETVLVLDGSIEKIAGEIISNFWGRPSEKFSLIGITGTNGKTTIAYLIEYLSTSLGTPTALFGTLVNKWPNYEEPSNLTTSLAEDLHENFAVALKTGISLAVMEVSSHSLSQSRVSGCYFSGAIFTNLTQDHLDYHLTMEKYFKAKSLLFEEPYLNKNVAKIIINIDDKWGQKLSKKLNNKCWKSTLDPQKVKDFKAELYMSNIVFNRQGATGEISTPYGKSKFTTPLIGKFNLMNLLQAIGSMLQHGFSLQPLLEEVSRFPGVPGRMNLIDVDQGLKDKKLPTVIVDYAHTPDALRNTLGELRRIFKKGKLICVFGCGGDRDIKKRPLMGKIASNISDFVVVTSDNPRNEDEMKIILEIMSGIENKQDTLIEVNRLKAIKIAIDKAEVNDTILIAGKGHENYQIIGDKKIFFDDNIFVKNILETK